MAGHEGKKPDLKEMFDKFDKDKDGKLTLEEVQAGFEELRKERAEHVKPPMMPGMGCCGMMSQGPGDPGAKPECCKSCPANKALEEKIEALEARIKVLEEKK
jgi:hypothetical protein